MSPRYFETISFLGLSLLAIALMVFIFSPYLGAIVLAITLAIIFNPVYHNLRRLMPRFAGIASFVTVIFAIIIILVPLIFFGFQIFQEAQGLYVNLTTNHTISVVSFFNEQINKIAPWLNFNLQKNVEQIIGSLVGSFGLIVSGLLNIALVIFLALVSLYFFLKDGYKLKEAVIKVSPLSEANTNKIISKLSRTTKAVIKGSLIVALVQGICVGLGFWLFGLDNPVLWGSVSVVASLIPVVGAALVVIPGMISFILSGNMLAAIIFAFWCFSLTGAADYFLRPLLIEKDVDIHPLMVLFSVLGGLATFGATGFLLGPLILSFFLTLVEIYPTIVLKQE